MAAKVWPQHGIRLDGDALDDQGHLEVDRLTTQSVVVPVAAAKPDRPLQDVGGAGHATPGGGDGHHAGLCRGAGVQRLAGGVAAEGLLHAARGGGGERQRVREPPGVQLDEVADRRGGRHGSGGPVVCQWR